MYKGCIFMLKKRKKNGFTLVELLAVIVILAVVILIAVTAVIPRMNNAKKKALVDEALMYLKAAKESIVFDADQSPSCINVSNLNEKYIKKSSDSYTGVVKNEYVNGELSQTINLTNGGLYIVGTDNLTSNDVKSTMPKGFAASCGDYNPILAENADTNTLAYKLLMSEGGSTLDANLNIINQRTSTVNFNIAEKDAANSGLYKAEDDDGASFYYRGAVSNNWVEFGDFYWRIVRINGDGSIRLIYTGLSSSNHTGANAIIKDSSNNSYSTFSVVNTYHVNTPDISGLTNTQIETTYTSGRFANAYVGYMYNPEKTLMTFPNKELSSASSNKLNNFPTFSSIDNTRQYYFFKNFDLNTDCFIGDGDEGACTLKCRELGEDCISSNWYSHASTEGNYSTSAAGVYTNSTTSMYVYTSDYKYSCWGYTTPVTKENSDGTTSVYISCPMVSEIIGMVYGKADSAVIKYHGLYSPSYESSIQNVYDSNIKIETENWYQNNIFNKNDGASTPNSLEAYLTDGIFCNDRTSETTIYPFNNKNSFLYGSYSRNINSKNPTLKCPNKQNDGFTLGGSSSTVVPSQKGNGLLKYPVGSLSIDEAVMAGAKHSTENKAYYLYINKTFWLIAPYYFYSPYVSACPGVITGNGSMTNYTSVYASSGIRPVINLKSSVLYDSGSGTEADPYKVKLSS